MRLAGYNLRMNSIHAETLNEIIPHDRNQEEIDQIWNDAVSLLKSIYSKILVLDDDPTGSQTVYDIPVYTGYEKDDLLAAREDDSHIVYILTNSRSLHAAETTELHRKLIQNWKSIEREGDETLIVSRSDSTLRGHYPLETDIIAEELSRAEGKAPTILIPFFPEGGRYTLGDTHYVQEGEKLIPAAETEFARDSSFGYTSSHLPSYVEEKTGGRISAGKVRSVSIEELRDGDINPVIETLNGLSADSALIVNAVTYDDLKVFLSAFTESSRQGRRFIFRTAAGLVKILAGLKDKPLLGPESLYPDVGRVPSPASPGVMIAGSYVGKTTSQLEILISTGKLQVVELNIRHALRRDHFAIEVKRASDELNALMSAGNSVVIYTCVDSERGFLTASESEEDLSDLDFSSRISDGLVQIVTGIKLKPSWIVTKGGITSHDIATRALGIQRAMVLGQLIPGVPVWRCGVESRWPGIPLVIFPGNVGDRDALSHVVAKLQSFPGDADKGR